MNRPADGAVADPAGAQRCVVTGASGFVGQALVAALRARGRDVIPLARREDAERGFRAAPPLGGSACWTPFLEGAGQVVHLAARVHVMKDEEVDPLAAFRAVNVTGTLELARQAAEAKVKRFVFASSVKVHGENSPAGRALRETDALAPVDPYARSKAEAEEGLRDLCARSGMELVVIRPPLVYGPGVKANFRSIVRWVATGMPLPLGCCDANRRSLVALDNLVDLIITCLDHPRAAGGCFFAADGEDLSTAALVRRLATATGRPARLWPVPLWMLRLAAAGTGRHDVLQRLCGSLQVDISSARETLGWIPPIGVDEGLRRTVAGVGR